MSRLRAFYQTALGAPLKFADGDRWIQFDLQGTNFSLSSLAEAAQNASGTVIVFEVDSLDDAESALAAQGGRVMERREMGPPSSDKSRRRPVLPANRDNGCSAQGLV